MPSFGSRLDGVDPSVGHMGLDLAVEKTAYAGGHAFGIYRIVAGWERHALGVAQLRVGLGVAVGVTTDGGCFVAFGKGGEDRLSDSGGEFEA